MIDVKKALATPLIRGVCQDDLRVGTQEQVLLTLVYVNVPINVLNFFTAILRKRRIVIDDGTARTTGLV